MSRHDNVGFFWEDAVGVGRQKHSQVMARTLPKIPDSGWRPPTDFPNLANAKTIALDCETKDVDLREKGPGVRRGAHIVGIAVGTDDGGRWYFPMRHEVGGEMNLPPENVIAWAKDNLTRHNQPKVGANLLYDLDFLYAAGVKVSGPFCDIQIAEPLINESALTYSVDALARKYLGERKVTNELYDWSRRAYGGKAGDDQRENIYRCPPSLVGPYAEGDVDLPLRIFEQQRRILAEQELERVFDIETRLIPLLLAMRQRGVRVDLAGAQRAYEDLSDRIKRSTAALGGINVYAADDIARLCNKLGITYLKSPSGRPSFVKEWLQNHEHQSMRRIAEIRQWYKMRDTFIKGYVIDSSINGRIHCQFNQLRSDDTGTVSGRFSSSNPNLQNIPSRDPEWGPRIRSLFLPDWDEVWARFDWSQIEFRFLTHYAMGDGADIAREMYKNDPTTDFHEMTAQLTGIDRKPAKNINFGLVYGMGERHMAFTLNRSLDDVKPLFETYHSRMPFIKTTFNRVMSRAANRGYIVTLLGRRRRFDMWEEDSWNNRDGITYASRELAVEAISRRYAKEGSNNVPKVKRAHTNAALNALLQGGAADAMKLAMVQLWESGICSDSALGPMLLTVHDETDWSVPPERLHLLRDVRQIMQDCVSLRVPIVAELETGPNWGYLTEEVL